MLISVNHLLLQSNSDSLLLTWSRYLPQCKPARLLPRPAGASRRLSALLWRLAALSQDAVQPVELPQETPVGDDASVVLHRFDGLHQRQVLSDHQVGQNQSGWAAHSHSAVDQHLTYTNTEYELWSDVE